LKKSGIPLREAGSEIALGIDDPLPLTPDLAMSERDIFTAALEMTDPAARSAYLDQACADDAALRQRVVMLLGTHGNAGDFLERPAVEQIGADGAPASDATAALDPAGRPEPALTRIERGDDQEEAPLDFLQPSTKPGSLGRLGHYEVLEMLGRGGFGIVVKAFDETLHRVVAIKIISVQLAATSPARKRFLREARASAAVRHESVVAIHAVEEQPIPYLVMEYIPGQTLQQKLDQTGPLDVLEVLRLGCQIANGLAAAHAMGLIHRDIKPANILLESGVEPRVKITDFGLARAADDASLTQSGVIAGTPRYMAPEQAQGEVIDQRADLFSLGSVLYVMVSGRPPFRASTTLAVLKRVAEDTPRPIREIIPEVPEWLCEIVAKLHAKKPEERFQTAKEVAVLLGQHLAELQSGAPRRAEGVSDRRKANAPVPASPVANAPGSPRRRSSLKRGVVVAAACLLAVLAIAAGVYFWPPGLFKDIPVTNPAIHQDMPPLAVAPFDAAQAKAHQEAWAKHLGVEVEDTNSIGMKLRLIPPGQFLMGSPDDEPGREAHEGPQHEVVLTKPFYMGVHDVTVGQFKAFVKAKGYQTEAEKGGGSWRPFPDGWWKSDPQVNWQNPGFEQSDDHPVVCVSWNDAKAFCDWLSDREGKKYALPTEAQWEYACRAGSSTTFSFGDDEQELGQYSLYKANSKGKTNPVGQKKPNAWGLYDLEGNVTQWTADWYTADYYQKSPKKDPPGPRASTVGTRVLRGGCWWDGAVKARAAHRYGDGFWTPWKSGIDIGLRVVQIGDLKASPVEVAPFVVLAAKGQPERSFATLKDAVDKAQAGDTIEIRGNGPFQPTPMNLDKALTLRAGAGYRPVLVHTTDGYLLNTSAPLALEGLEIHSFGNQQKSKESQWGLIGAYATSLRIAHCRILVAGRLYAIWTWQSPLVEVKHSEIFSSECAVDSGVTDGARFVIQNCCLGRSPALVLYENGHDSAKLARDAEVELIDNTFVSDRKIWVDRFFHDPVDVGKEDIRSVRFKAVGNVFQSRLRFGVVEDWDGEGPFRPDALADWYRAHVTWAARDNLFAVKDDFLAFTPRFNDQAQERTLKTSKDWQAFWKVEKDAGIEGTPRFAGGDLLERLEKDPLSLTPADFRLEKGSPGQGAGPDGKDLGADVDRVGPGAAYEDWKKTEEYQEWRKKTEELMKSP
jgi:eukaryotic-like serine/threonine-protein kinase